jgi:hypothetical protein
LHQIAQALEYLNAHSGFQKEVWVATPGDIAKYAASLSPGLIP